MTHYEARGIPHRPRAARTENGPRTDLLLGEWRKLVERAERGAATHQTGCPQCDGSDGLDARDDLERLVRRGGRRQVRIGKRLEALDERFRQATTPAPFSPDGPGWWRYRNLG
ncbi:hypothetical protein GCM10028777_13030 [Angustibacter speluncae]